MDNNSYNEILVKQRGHGHMRSASLENANSLLAKNTLGLPVHSIGNGGGGNGCGGGNGVGGGIGGFSTGTLKSSIEQKRMKNKFGSYNNLDEYAAIIHNNKSKFQNLKNMFEMKIDYGGNISNGVGGVSGVGSNAGGNYPNSIHHQRQPFQQAQPQQQQQHKQQQLNHHHQNVGENLNIVETPPSSSTSNNEATKLNSGNIYQAKNLLKPIAFKPIPFEPDYSIPNRYAEFCDRYGSTPSLAPIQGSNMKFGSTSDLRHGYSYCANLARRRCARSFKINDSMESVSHTPDSDAISQSSTIKSINKFSQEQFDTTPSPSDSGISELEAALKDRDSELSYLRQTMEHNEKDKEAFWEQETKRLKNFYENQHKEQLSKIKKLEQMLTLQSFQFKQNRLRFTEDASRLKEQFNDTKNENELLRNEADGLKTSERTMRDRVNQLEQKVDVMDKLIVNLKSQLEENEWTVCQKNGEIALLKTQLKEAKMELTAKDHELVHVKAEIQNKVEEEQNIYTSNIRDEFKLDSEKSELNRIIILKDQVILALTNELSKLRKELSELAITHEYGEEPAGKYSRLKYKIENLANICHYQSQQQQPIPETKSNVNENHRNNDDDVVDDDIKKSKDTKNQIELEENDLAIIINCLQSTTIPPFTDQNQMVENNYEKQNCSNNSSSSLTMQQKRTQTNLPDVTQNILCKNANNNNHIKREIISKTHVNTITNNEKEEKDKMFIMKKEFDEIRKNFEIEKHQWAEEKEKVLTYQRQLQTHYIQMYQKMKDLENQLSKRF